MSGSIAQLENIEYHTLCPWICLIVLITIIRINMFVAYWAYIPLFSKVTLANGARSNSYLSMFTSKETLTFLRVPFQIYCAWEVCWRILVYSVAFALWLPWYTFFLLLINYSNIITYCSLKFLSSCGIILDLLHVLNCDPESRIWRGLGGGSFQRSRGGGGGSHFFIFFWPPPPPPLPLYLPL